MGKVNQEALDLTVERADGSRLQKDRLKKRLRKLAKEGGLERMTPLFQYRYCAARLSLGDFSDYSGWEWRDEAGWSADIWFNPQPIAKWQGGFVPRLLVRGEQGVGDEIFYASMLPECLARVGGVLYECDDRLHGIFERSFPRLECVSRRTDWQFEVDAFITAGDLMRVFRRDRKHFPRKPFLKVDDARVRRFDAYRGRIGVAWRGRQGSLDPLSLGIANPLSVQYGEQHPAIETPGIDLKDDLEGVFALVSVLDRVVTVPQTIHHVAGAIGKRVDILLPEVEGEIRNQIQWDYPLGELPWYDATVFRRRDWTISK